MTYVLDASLIIASLVDEADTDRAVPVVIDAQSGGWAPPHLFLEVSNALTMKLRRKLIVAAHRDAAFEKFGRYNITVDDDPDRVSVTRRAIGLADAHGLTLYDAAYLELALRRSATLGSLDLDLRKAGKALGLEVRP